MKTHTHEGHTFYKCKDCGKQYSHTNNKEYRGLDQLSYCWDCYIKRNSLPDSRGYVMCKVCGRWYLSYEKFSGMEIPCVCQVVKHLEEETIEGYHSCNICTKVLYLKKKYFNKTHEYDATKVICDVCLEQYRNEDILEEKSLDGVLAQWWNFRGRGVKLRIDSYYTENRLLLSDYFIIKERCLNTVADKLDINVDSEPKQENLKPLLWDDIKNGCSWERVENELCEEAKLLRDKAMRLAFQFSGNTDDFKDFMTDEEYLRYIDLWDELLENILNLQPLPTPLFTIKDLHIVLAKYRQIHLQYFPNDEWDNDIACNLSQNSINEIVSDFEYRFECNFDHLGITYYRGPDYDKQAIYLHYLNMRYSR